MLDYQQAELGPGVWLQDPQFPELVSDCWWGWSISDTVGYGIWGVLKLVVGLLVGSAMAQLVPG